MDNRLQSRDDPLTDVSRETQARLWAFVDLVLYWNRAINLIGPAHRDDVWTRHVVDSLQLAALAPSGFSLWADFGSGGGFPGMVLAIAASETAPDARFVLVESDRRKAGFLEAAAAQFSVSVEVVASRAEEVAPLDADVVSARALAPLDALYGIVQRHLRPGGVAILPKGRSVRAELERAEANWLADVDLVPSATDHEAKIVVARNVSRRTA